MVEWKRMQCMPVWQPFIYFLQPVSWINTIPPSTHSVPPPPPKNSWFVEHHSRLVATSACHSALLWGAVHSGPGNHAVFAREKNKRIDILIICREREKRERECERRQAVQCYACRQALTETTYAFPPLQEIFIWALKCLKGLVIKYLYIWFNLLETLSQGYIRKLRVGISFAVFT